MNTNKILNMTEAEKKIKIKEEDTKLWKEEMARKSTLHIYKTYKEEIKEIPWFDNTNESNLMTTFRTNTMQLNWRKTTSKPRFKMPGK